MRNVKGNLILLLTAIIWGTSFISQKLGMNYIEPFTFGASRFLLGAGALIPIILIFDRLNKKKKDVEIEEHKFSNKDLLRGGVLCGVAVFLGASLQQWGLVYTTAGKAGFITALYVVIVPLFGIFMHKKIDFITWIGVALAIIGLYFLCIQEGFSMQKGDAIVLMGTIFWALQIVIVDVYADKTEGLKLSFVQFVTAGILSVISAFIFETPDISSIIDCLGPILYTAIMVVGVAYTLQIIGQKYTNPTAAAIILSMESVFAVISGAIFLDELMSIRELIGCILMFIAVIITQIKPENILELVKKDADY
ncbi:MAG: DMT family transporter [Tissierellia bacterium]|nr:DMT family transporter [Tissierellia bacterium]